MDGSTARADEGRVFRLEETPGRERTKLEMARESRLRVFSAPEIGG